MSLTWQTSSYRSDMGRGEAPATRQGQILDAIVAYRYLAPAYLAHEERREQALAASALDQLPCDAVLRDRQPVTRANWLFGVSLLRHGQSWVVSCWRRVRRRSLTGHATPATALNIAEEGQ